MSQENVEVVRRALAALDSRDVEAYLEVASPQIELITPALPLQGPISGHEGIRDFFRDDIHPTDAGFYYVTMIHYAVLTGKSPVGLPRQLMGEYGAYPPVPKDQVEVLQQLAQETVAAFDKPD